MPVVSCVRSMDLGRWDRMPLCDIRRAGELRTGDSRIQSQSDRIEVGIGVGESLAKVIKAEDKLVGQARGKCRVVNQSPVLHVHRRGFEVGRQERTGRRNLMTCATKARSETRLLSLKAWSSFKMPLLL